MQDYARYPEFLTEVKAIRVGARTASSVEVTYRLDVKLKEIEFTLRHDAQRPHRIDWTLLRGEFMRLNRGSWTLESTGSGGTRATYSIELSLGAVPSGLEKALAEQGLPNMLAAFKARAEKLRKG